MKGEKKEQNIQRKYIQNTRGKRKRKERKKKKKT